MFITATKTIQFEEVMKLFKKFVATSSTRPVLQMVYYDRNINYFVATDSHRLLRVNAEYITDIPEGSWHLYNPKTNEISLENRNYPDTNRLMPQDYNIEINLNNSNIKELQGAFKQLKPIYKKNENKFVTADITRNNTKLSTTYLKYKDSEVEEDQVILDSVSSKYQDITLSFNGDYFQTALQTVKKLNKLSDDESKIKFVSNLRPFVINQGNVYDIIILPVRRY